MQMVSIRGAITIEKNDKKQILEATKKMLVEIGEKNNLDKNNVISIVFSATKDLNAEYPAKAARILGYNQCSLMCFNEMEVVESMKKCIRVMVLYNGFLKQNEINHVYLGKTKKLRPDLNI